ncbi:hypothetical protein NKH77_46520 [Streptomyces sp. M19]
MAEDQEYRGSEQFTRDREYWLERMADLPETVAFGGRTGVAPSGRVLRRRTDLGRTPPRRCGASPGVPRPGGRW